MGLFRLLSASIRFYLRDWIFLVLGAALSTMVVTGALLVGDSLRDSLARVGREKLGWVKRAMLLPRLVPEDIVDRLSQKGIHNAGILTTKGSVALFGTEGASVRGVQVYGVNESFWKGFSQASDGQNGIWMNPVLARLIGSTNPTRLNLTLALPFDTPRESLLGRKDFASGLATLEVPCLGTLGANDAGLFSLTGGISSEPVLFMPLLELQKALNCPKRINGLLTSGDVGPQAADKTRLTLEDYGLVLKSPGGRVDSLFAKHDRDKDGTLSRREWQGQLGEAMTREIAKGGAITRVALLDWYRRNRNHLTLESRQFYLGEPFILAAGKAALEVGLVSKPVFVHLVNQIRLENKELAYSVIAGISQPLGFGDNALVVPPPGKAMLLDFPGSPFNGLLGKNELLGKDLALSYFPAEHTGPPKELTVQLPLAGRLQPKGMAVDFELAPEFPGITDKLSLRDWNPPFPYDNKRIQPIDDTFWKEYRAAPKVVVDLALAQKLFGSRFGQYTSVIVEAEGVDADQTLGAFREKLLANLDPAASGLSWIPLAQQADLRSAGNMDFSGLFLGFSFFLLVSAIGLFALLLRLHLERRMGEWGLCTALGWTRRRIMGRILAEAIGPGLVGIALGSPLAVWYCGLLSLWLEAHWPGGGLVGKLSVAASPKALALGSFITLATLLLSVFWRTRSILHHNVSDLLVGDRADSGTTLSRGGGKGQGLFFGSLLGCWIGVVGLSILGPQLDDAEARAGCFFGAGALGLTSFLMLFRWLLRVWDLRGILDSRHWIILGFRGATRKPGRSLLSVGLLASSVFLLFAVDAFHRSAQTGNEGDKASWSGGFRYWIELDQPLFQGLDTAAGKSELLDNIERAAKTDPAAARKRAAEVLDRADVVALRLREGDDISCLNLMQSGRPRLLGVPQSLLKRGGFRFAAKAKGHEANPWRVLEEPGNLALGEKNTLMWTLHKGMGDTVSLGKEESGGFSVIIAGILADSVFQSELLLSQKRLLELDPTIQGYRVLLAGCPAEDEAALMQILATGLAPLGPVIRTSRDRLDSFLAVENTYLATFQALGWLGLLLGMVGLAIAQARSMLERSAEWALLGVLGFSRNRIGILVMTESVVLVLAGLLTGLGAALIAVWPQLGDTGLAWMRILLLSGLVGFCGLGSSLLSVLVVARLGLLRQLRSQG